MAIECGTAVYKGKSLDEIDFELEREYCTITHTFFTFWKAISKNIVRESGQNI